MNDLDVVILGGGWSGLLMLKSALERGLTAVVLEAREAPGGVWRFSEDPALVTVMATTEMTSSTCFTEMSDFPMPKGKDFLRHDEVLAYLGRYVERFGLAPHLRFGHRVLRCEKIADGAPGAGRWRVTTSQGTFVGKNLAVCTGVHGKRNLAGDAELFGAEREGGPRVRHIGAIKRVPADLDGKRVMVLGGGESASDLIEEMMRRGRTARVVWSIPNGQHFFRKYGYWFRRHLITGRPLRPEAFDKQSSLFQGLISPAYKGKDGMRWGCRWTTSGSLIAYQGHGVPEWRNGAANMHAFINKSANVLDYLDYQRLVPKGAIARVEGTTVHFRDGTQEEVDEVVLCTGYIPDFPFLPAAIGETPLTLHYKYVFCNDDPSVAFVGFVRPIFGSIPLIAEVQSRWVARVFAGELTLPETASRKRKTLREKAYWEHFFKDTSRRISTLVDVFIYTYGIGRMTGEFPDRRRLLREDPYAFYLSVVAPFHGAMLRLNDPRARAAAKEAHDHHRIIRWNTAPLLGIQVAVKLTRFDALLAALEEVKYRAQRSPRARALAETPLGKAVRGVLAWPKKRFFVPSYEYPWKQGEAAAATREDAAREDAARETAARETAAREAASLETAAREVASRETAARETAARETAARETAAREAAPREAASREAARSARSQPDALHPDEVGWTG